MFIMSIMAITIVFMLAAFIVTVSYFLSKPEKATGVMLASGETIYTEEELNNLIVEREDVATEEMLTYIRGELEEGRSTTSILQELYPQQTVLARKGKYHFFDLNPSLSTNIYDDDAFSVDENGILSYNNGETTSKKGIDVSRYQGAIDWSKVKSEENIEGALENGIDVGVYFLSQAINEEEAIEEAEYVLEAIRGYDITYPVVIDVEEITTDTARTDDLTKEQWTKNCIAFCETIEEAGYTPMIYGNLTTFFFLLDMEQLEEYEKWVAWYGTPIYFPYKFTIWQYTDEGTVDGIDSDVDLNVGFYDPTK